MAHKLKQFRVKAMLSQAKLAKAVGVSQPNYQRWESGAAPIPKDKLAKLAKILKTNPDALLGRHPPVLAGFYDKSVGEDLNYYGEVAVHFAGSGAPLLLSITDGAFSRLHRALQQQPSFVTVESLSNQTVVIRANSIADVYFSSEAYDDFGPEHDSYVDHASLQMPDARDWEIVEELSFDGDLSAFSAEDVKRVSKAVMITDLQYKTLVAEGKIKPDELESEVQKNAIETEKIFERATHIKYQLSNGKQRTAHISDDKELFDSFYELIDFSENFDDARSKLIRIPIEGWHRIAFINSAAIDYIILPTHRFERGRTETDASMLDESDNT
ncbi:helix-turn-helix transcriptional regulator [Xanthomonas sp. 3307]|uniref:helix-turn-helix domain-containing protein n=1 Tax=Xanthomonas sp. 3307 TaxID=3035316 RepID=UPI00161962FF|nr:helix-turn-helix transcriptional regulator [Xanthomonas sp. 3307]MBB5941220.1 transcriptional regulator with XRE-family HTH domain [Xanthomonas sp. 3307]